MQGAIRVLTLGQENKTINPQHMSINKKDSIYLIRTEMEYQHSMASASLTCFN
jgi:hypothetical protein